MSLGFLSIFRLDCLVSRRRNSTPLNLRHSSRHFVPGSRRSLSTFVHRPEPPRFRPPPLDVPGSPPEVFSKVVPDSPVHPRSYTRSTDPSSTWVFLRTGRPSCRGHNGHPHPHRYSYRLHSTRPSPTHTNWVDGSLTAKRKCLRHCREARDDLGQDGRIRLRPREVVGRGPH